MICRRRLFSGFPITAALWPVATGAMKQGFPVDTISTDLHPDSIILPQVNMPNCIAKLMALGMSLQGATTRATVNPAHAIRRFPELGALIEGRGADIAVFELKTGNFPLIDSARKKMKATQKLECVMTPCDGKIVNDGNGLSLPLCSTEVN